MRGGGYQRGGGRGYGGRGGGRGRGRGRGRAYGGGGYGGGGWRRRMWNIADMLEDLEDVEGYGEINYDNQIMIIKIIKNIKVEK